MTKMDCGGMIFYVRYLNTGIRSEIVGLIEKWGQDWILRKWEVVIWEVWGWNEPWIKFNAWYVEKKNHAGVTFLHYLVLEYFTLLYLLYFTIKIQLSHTTQP